MGKRIFGNLLYPVHCFIVGDILIDTGSISAQKDFLNKIDELNSNNNSNQGDKIQISKILITHSHEDHTGNISSLNEKFGGKIDVYAHRDSLKIISNPKLLNLKLYQKIAWGLPKPYKETIEIGSSVKYGDYFFKVIPTPGHSDDHVCFYEPNKKWLFTGDLFLGERIKNLRKDENFNQILQSLEKLSKLEIKVIFCGLKGIIEDGNNKLKNKIKNMKKIKKEIIKLYKDGKSPKKIRKLILGKEDHLKLISTGHFSKQYVINSILKDYKNKP